MFYYYYFSYIYNHNYHISIFVYVHSYISHLHVHLIFSLFLEHCMFDNNDLLNDILIGLFPHFGYMKNYFLRRSAGETTWAAAFC
jgi:hypothetical protein